MLMELMNHNELGVKFYRDENSVIFVEDEKIGVILKLSVYENISIFHRQGNDVEAIKRQIEIAKHYDEVMAGTWRPETERKFTRIR
ncbi:MAG: hypothetical protein KIC44_02895 [Fusobacterium periodonticum]|nr:hypothetical protein [Fusobacterium periodonticum]